MSGVCVCLLVVGRAEYFRAGRLAARSVLRHTDFELFVALGEGPGLALPGTPRLQTRPISLRGVAGDRAEPFLLKFRALDACLGATDADVLLLLDADAVLVDRINRARIDAALGGRSLGMVEQTGIRGSGMTRAHFLAHYVNHTLAWFARGAQIPGLEDFRFYNSGVVLGRRTEFEGLVRWALSVIEARSGRPHQVGEHMIADQDYFQFWANSLHPGVCAPLPWFWNHCEHWDAEFPRRGALIAHFSNFCKGPDRRQVMRMRAMARWPTLFRWAGEARGWVGRARAG
jgi:hypothetical protein